MSEYSIGGGPNQPQINPAQTTQVYGFNGENIIFQVGYIFRKVSKFLAGTDEDAVIPFQVFFEKGTNKILKDTLPPEFHEELKDYLM